MKQNV